jgi:hypothetical protein
VSLATNSLHLSAPRRRLAAFSSSPLALLAASSSALRCIHLDTNLCTEFWLGTLCPALRVDDIAEVGEGSARHDGHRAVTLEVMVLQLTGVTPDPALLDLPWAVPLEDWPASAIVSLPRGLSRHTVRFVRLGDDVYAIKELTERYAKRESAPARSRATRCSGRRGRRRRHRVTDEGELDSALITKHLQFPPLSRPVLHHTPQRRQRGCSDALAVLLVRLHLAGFTGEIARCPTSVQARLAHSPPIWWTPRPASCIRR